MQGLISIRTFTHSVLPAKSLQNRIEYAFIAVSLGKARRPKQSKTVETLVHVLESHNSEVDIVGPLPENVNRFYHN